MDKMRAVRLFGPGDLRCVEIDKPKPQKKDEVLIKIKACGICGSDLMRVMVKGAHKHPITIGHEFSGTVEEVGDSHDQLAVGERVTVIPLVPCRKCDYCQVGQHVLCDHYSYYGSRINGALADYILVDPRNVFKIPRNVGFEEAAMTDPAAVALHAVRKAKIEPGQRIAVFGLGAIGLITLQWLQYIGCREVYGIDIISKKFKLAKIFGADFTIHASHKDAAEAIREKTGQKGVDAAIELAGSKQSQIQAINSVKKQGKVILFGISNEDLIIPNAILNKMLRDEIEVVGAWNSLAAPLPVNEWAHALHYMRLGKIKCKPIISHRFRLEQCREAFDMMFDQKECFNKVMFKPEA